MNGASKPPLVPEAAVEAGKNEEGWEEKLAGCT